VKLFNVAGPCFPDEHYMIPAHTRCPELDKLVAQGLYFVLHAPRQTGKTTLIDDFVERLCARGKYLALYCTVEAAQDMVDVETGITAIISSLHRAIEINSYFEDKAFGRRSGDPASAALVNALGDYARRLEKPLVIMFDEADCLSDALLISFLRQLRQGFIERRRAPFVHALGLVGMRNIRDYKSRIRAERASLGSASPFNIVTKALTIANFSRDEVGDLLAQHGSETGQFFPDAAVDLIYELTQGQPWLCNAIGREIVVEMLDMDARRAIEMDHVKEAVERIIQRRDTHIDSLLERLKEPRVRRIVESVIMGRPIDIDFTNEDAAFAFDLGLLRFDRGDVRPGNPIYGEVMIRMLTFNSQHHLPVSLEGRWIRDGILDVSALLAGFQQFWRENSEIWVEKYDYKEAAPHLILQAYLQRIVNGGGTIQREYSAGRGRFDLCVTVGENRYPIELKIRYDAGTRDKGLEQLSGYMDTLGVTVGWLVVFDRDPERPWDTKIFREEITHKDKTIHIFGC